MNNKQAFTILELILVVLIIGILLALTVPRIKIPYGRYNLEAAAYCLAEDIRLHMQQSINAEATMDIYKITFDCISEKYYLQKNFDVLRIVYLPASVDLVRTNFDYNAINVLKFNISGKPYPRGGTIELRDKYSEKYLYVIIASHTGRVRVDTSPPSSGYE